VAPYALGAGSRSSPASRGIWDTTTTIARATTGPSTGSAIGALPGVDANRASGNGSDDLRRGDRGLAGLREADARSSRK